MKTKPPPVKDTALKLALARQPSGVLASPEEALRVGASIEESDILDLEERMAQTDKEDIRLVYSNLKWGSENHLRAFVNDLERRGIEYLPEYLSQQEYNGMISG
jgi:hypothetical protein